MKALLVAAIAVSFVASVSAGGRRAKVITVEMHSTPEGAQLFDGDVLWGATPIALKYTLTAPCQMSRVVRMRWASGAEASSTVQLCAAVGKRQTFTLARPAAVEGLAVDLQVAFQQAQIAAQQAMAAQLQANTEALDYASFVQTLNGAQRAAAAPKPFMLCVSRDVARGVVYVACQ